MSTDPLNRLLHKHGLQEGDEPSEVTREASLLACPNDPLHPSIPGFGYRGGGFGAYRICAGGCVDTVFGKVGR